LGELKSEYLSLLLSANSTMSAIALGLDSVQPSRKKQAFFFTGVPSLWLKSNANVLET